MLSILLHVLLIIGKIILVILCAILVLILLILLMPIVYRADLYNDPQKLQVGGSVSWFMRLIFVKTSFSAGELSYEIYLFGIPLMKLFDKLKGRKKKPKQEEPSSTIHEVDVETPVVEELSKESSEDKSIEAKPEDVAREISDEEVASKGISFQETTKQAQFDERSKEVAQSKSDAKPMPSEEVLRRKQATVERLKAIEEKIEAARKKKEAPPEANDTIDSADEKKVPLGERIEGFFEKIDVKVDAFTEKVSNGVDQAAEKVDKASDMMDKVLDETTTAAIGHVLKHALRLVKSYLPRHLRGSIDYNLGNPARNGKALGFYYTFSGLCPNRLDVTTDFESTDLKLDVDLHMSGHIILMNIIFRALLIVLNRDIWRTYKLFRGKKKGKKGSKSAS